MSACLTPSGKTVEVHLKGAAISVARDAVFYVPANKQMDLQLTTPISKASGDPQLLFVHADSNSGDSAPTICAEGQDNLAISAAVALRSMLYSPCGLNGNISVSFSGQLYTANSGNHLVLSSFTCKPMGWLPAFGNLSCGVKGEGGALDTSKDVVSLDILVYQTSASGWRSGSVPRRLSRPVFGLSSGRSSTSSRTACRRTSRCCARAAARVRRRRSTVAERAGRLVARAARRCAVCEAPISARYPLVEAITGRAFAVVTWWASSIATSASLAHGADRGRVGARPRRSSRSSTSRRSASC